MTGYEGDPLVRYPFRQAVKEYMNEYSGILADETVKMRTRAYRRIGDQIEFLHSDGKISTVDPHLMTVSDVRVFIASLRSRGLAPSTLNSELALLQNILMFRGNDAVRFARIRYPHMVPQQQKGGGPIVPSDIVMAVRDAAEDSEPQDLLRWMPVVIALGTGARLNEFRCMSAEDFDLRGHSARIAYPKGYQSWGRVRHVPIRPEFFPLISQWVGSLPEGPVFPGPHGPLSRNTLGIYRAWACERIGFRFDFQMCRRTYGQAMLDEGVPLETVSVILGHSRTETTDVFYARVRNDTAVREMVGRWYENAGSEGESQMIGWRSAEREI